MQHILYTRRTIFAGLFLTIPALLLAFAWVLPSRAATGINERLTYQARLFTNTGAVVTDGSYNIEFKIYQDGTGCEVSGTPPCSGTLKWTETRSGANKVTVTNGYLSVELGSVSAFGSSVDWNQDTLWLSINIGGTGTPTWDGEMTPFRRLAASPYALNAKQLGGLSAGQFLQFGQGSVQADSSTNNSVYINKTGASGDILQLQKNGTSMLTLANDGDLTLGTADNNGTLFVLDVKNDAGDPATTVEGSMYYNNNANKFRCYQNTGWTDCIGAGGGGGAPTDSQYLVLQADSTLSAERILTAGTNVTISDGGANGNLTISACATTCALPGDISPTQITADQNDYNPANLSTSTVLRLDASQFVSITGLAGGADGRLMSLVNVGSQPIRLADENTASTAANRFALGGDIMLMPNDAQVLIYDSTSSRWRTFSINVSSRSLNPTSRILMYDDFITTAVTSVHGWAATVSGTGASCQAGTYGTNATNKALGVWQCDTGTVATGRGAMNLGTATIVPGQGSMVFMFRVAVEALSTSTEEYNLKVGLFDQTGTGDAVDGIYFDYDRALAGDFWRIAAAGTSTRTKVTSATAVNTNYIWLMAVTNPAWTSVDYFAKANASTTWTDLGNISDANVPTATEMVAPIMKLEKTVGTTQRNADIDSFFMYYDIQR